MNLDRPWHRLIGLAVILVCLALYEPGAPGMLHKLVYPLVMAAGAWALVQNAVVVAIAGTVLAAIHTELGSGDWIPGIAYPALTLAGGVLLLATAVLRFRRRIAETHDARWRDRRPS
ncbi:MAG: hypothetical protein AB7I04_09590 [Pseudomonadales bacterium]